MIRATPFCALLIAVVTIASSGCSSSATTPEVPVDKSAFVISESIIAGRAATPASIDKLRAGLSSTDATARRDAAFGFGIALNMNAPREAIATALLDAVAGETDTGARGAMFWALGRSADARAVGVLGAALRDVAGTAPELSTQAALALGVLGRGQVALDDATRGRLVALTTSEDRDGRYAGAIALAREHEPPVDPAVLRTLEALASDADVEIRAAALVGLQRRKRGQATFITALDDAEWRVSVEAARGLLALKSPAATAALARWVETSIRDKKVRPHPMRVALEGFAELADMRSVQRAARVVSGHARGNKLTIDDGQVLCLGAAIRARQRASLPALRQCGGPVVPAWWRASVVAGAIVDSTHLDFPTRVRELEALAENTDARIRAAAIAAAAKLGTTPGRDGAIALIRGALADESVAVAGTAADALTALALDKNQLAEIAAIVIPRAEKELAGNSELGLTLINAIAASRMIAGKTVCTTAAGHQNRTVRAAATSCLEALGVTAPPPKDPPARASAPDAGAPSRWSLNTTRGFIIIELDPATAPRHVEAVTRLTREKFYDGLVFHRVVADFVVQGGDPTGTGWGGPKFVIPAEPSPVPFDRGAVGIADAGPDTGGSQLFIMHTRAPRLEGRYTRIGRVVEGMTIVDALTVGDSITWARIESASP